MDRLKQFYLEKSFISMKKYEFFKAQALPVLPALPVLAKYRIPIFSRQFFPRPLGGVLVMRQILSLFPLLCCKENLRTLYQGRSRCLRGSLFLLSRSSLVRVYVNTDFILNIILLYI